MIRSIERFFCPSYVGQKESHLFNNRLGLINLIQSSNALCAVQLCKNTKRTLKSDLVLSGNGSSDYEKGISARNWLSFLELRLKHFPLFQIPVNRLFEAIFDQIQNNEAIHSLTSGRGRNANLTSSQA